MTTACVSIPASLVRFGLAQAHITAQGGIHHHWWGVAAAKVGAVGISKYSELPKSME